MTTTRYTNISDADLRTLVDEAIDRYDALTDDTAREALRFPTFPRRHPADNLIVIRDLWLTEGTWTITSRTGSLAALKRFDAMNV